MNFRLFMPWLYTAKNRFWADKKTSSRTSIIVMLALAVCFLIYLGSIKVLGYFHAQDELGVILSLKIFQMMWIMLFSMLIFSAMITAVSTIYLSEDNEIFLAAPRPHREIFRLRFFITSLSTSWMVVIFSLPVFGAYGKIFDAGLMFWPLVLFAVPSVALIGTGIASLITISIVFLFPARRTKDIIFYLSLLFGVFLYLVFRMIRPEELVNPEQYGQFIEYFSAISRPVGPWLPAAWGAKLLSTYLLDRQIDWLLTGLLTTTPLVLFFAGEFAMDRLFLSGYSKSQESFAGGHHFKPPTMFQGQTAWFFRKELRHFTRDSAEWSQFFMIAALIVVYLYNFKVLPLDRSPIPTVYISNLIGFANIGLTGFLAASLATRFVYPSIGSEKGAFYLITSGPLTLKKFLSIKFLFYVGPFTLLTLLLIIASNHLLQISGPLEWISVITALIMTWTVLGMALGFGSLYADFKAENRVASMGPGAILFLLSAMLYQLLFLGAGLLPTYRLLKKGIITPASVPLPEIFSIIIWLTTGTTVSAIIVVIICKKGIRRLSG
ncbi:putative ABC transporter permease subunit [Desulforhopalus sp. 52FAK]